MIDYASVCSGIEAATMAFHPLGWKPVWFSEIEPFPCKVLKHHYPQIPNLGDMLKLENDERYKNSKFRLLVGGTPCQSFSIAGLRGGLADGRGNLALEYCRILMQKQPQWFIWENVPGVFSSFSDEAGSDNGFSNWQTSDFATLLTAFRECGYSCAWRVLDAQFFGVPQRRKRIFVVGYLGDNWRAPAAVLLEPQSLRGDIKKGGKPGEKITFTVGTGFKADRGESSNLITMATGQANAEIGDNISPAVTCNHEQVIAAYNLNDQVAGTLNSRKNSGGITAQDVRNDIFAFQNQVSDSQPMNVSEVVPTLDKSKVSSVLYSLHGSDKTVSTATEASVTHCLRARPSGQMENSTTSIVQAGSIVRRLTPLEYERLQGFPDNFTNILGATDSARYKAIGNSMAVPVMRWIAERIDFVDALLENSDILY